MVELTQFLPFGALILPTVLLAPWQRTRPYAHLPALAFLPLIGGLVSFGMGGFLRAAALDPAHYRCGNPFVIPLFGLVAIGAWTTLGGLALAVWRRTRSAGMAVLFRVLPVFLAACLICGVLGRYGSS